MKKLIILASLFFFSGCTSDKDWNKGKHILEMQGFTDVENTGHNWNCCAEKETYSTGFRCKDKEGNIVEGCFCSSMLKGMTIRFD